MVRVGDDEVGGREAARAGVEGGASFALFGARAGGGLRVGALSTTDESKHTPYNAVAEYRDVEVDEKSDLPTTQS